MTAPKPTPARMKALRAFDEDSREATRFVGCLGHTTYQMVSRMHFEGDIRWEGRDYVLTPAGRARLNGDEA